MPRRPEKVVEFETELLGIAYGLDQFTIREVSDVLAAEKNFSKREMYKIAQDLFKYRFEIGHLEKIQEHRQHKPIIYRWASE